MNRGEHKPGWGHAFESPGRGSALGAGEKERACGKEPAKSREHDSGRGPASGRGLVTDEGQDFKNVESVSGGSWLFRFRLAKKGEPGGPWEGWGPPVKAGACPWRRRKIRPGRRDDAVFKLRKWVDTKRGGAETFPPSPFIPLLRCGRRGHRIWRGGRWPRRRCR